jgi:Na+/proline symporter
VLFPSLPFHNRESAFGMVVRLLLPSGLLGLTAASLVATAMSTCSAFMIDAAALFTEDLYRPLIAPKRPDRHYLVVARIASFVVTAVAFVIGTTMPSVISATVHFISILPFIGVSFWIGIIWPRANRVGAWTSTVGSAVVYFGAIACGVSNAWASLDSLLFGIVGMIVGSYCNAPEDAAGCDRIFHYLKVPIGEESLLLAKEEVSECH